MIADNTCKECGAVIPAESQGGCCPRCLLRLGLQEVWSAYSGAENEEGQEGRQASRQDSQSAKTSSPQPAIQYATGDRIGRYRLMQEIGHGGCGVVYMAEQEEPVRRKVALKVIKLGMDTRQVVARFEAERQALALMEHPNIAKVLDAGATDTGRPYFVMELVGGIKITDYCDQNHLATRQRLDLFIQVCRAIQHAHQKGIIHRDIKPSNVLVATQDGVAVPKVIDFGIAKAAQGRLTDETFFTAFEQFLGTPAYMSPEQAQLGGLDVDTRSDIYSLGVLLYELLTGKTPFDTKELLAAGLEAMRRTIQEREPPTPSTRIKQELVAGVSGKSKIQNAKSKVANDLDWIVMKCLEKDRARRYETANGLARDLERHLNNEPVAAGPPSRAYRLQKLIWRNRATAAATGIVLLVLFVGTGVSTWQAVRATRAERKSTREATKSEQVATFLKEMLESVGPSKALGRDTTMLKEILDKTAERIGQELTNQPEVEIEIRDVLARTYDDLALYPQAAEMIRENLRIARGHFGEEDLSVAQAFKILGNIQMHQGNYAEAEKAIRASMRINRKLLGAEDPEVAITLDNLGAVLVAQSRLPEAESLQREAFAIRRKTLGDEAFPVAVSLANLAYTLQQAGRLAEAETMSRQALELLRKLRGQEHPDVATALNNLGLIFSDERKFTEEEAIHREALAMRRNLLGNEHPAVAQSLHNLAAALQQQDKPAAAEPLVREALEISRKRLGGEHPDVTHSLNTLGNILRVQGKLDEAEQMHRQALEMRRRILGGEEHIEVAVSMNNLAETLVQERKFAEAEALYRQSLTLNKKLLAEKHPLVAATLLNLAQVLMFQNQPTNAESFAREALAIRRNLFGETHPETFDAINSLTQLLLKEGKFEDAEKLDREVLTGLRAHLPAEHPQLARALYGLAATLILQKKFAEAEPIICECLAIREKAMPDDWRTFNTRSMLAEVFFKQEKYAEAELSFLAGYAGMNQREAVIRGSDRALLRRPIEELSELYLRWERPDQAASWKMHLAEFDRKEADRR